MFSYAKKSTLISLLFAVLVLVLASLACGGSTPEVRSPQDNPSSQSDSSTPLSQATVTLKPVGSARSNPAPFGYEVTVEHMTFTVTELVRPADAIVSQGSIYNTKPAVGQEYVFVKLSITCNRSADENCSIIEFEFQLVGSAGQTHDAEMFLSGVNSLMETGEFFGGVTKSGNLAFTVGKDETNLILIYEPLLGDAVYMSVEP